MERTLFTMGYGNWDAKRRIAGMMTALEQNGLTTLVDIRHSPCASDPIPNTNYSAKDWNLQASGGIEEFLNANDIQYRWLPELGNPQKRDRTMKIMRAHLESDEERWPIIRGLRILAELVRIPEQSLCLLCTCPEYKVCHRHLVAESLNSKYFDDSLGIIDLGKSGPMVCKP